MNHTDLHIKFKQETGKSPHWQRKDSQPQRYQKSEGYSSIYAEWLEEKFLELLKTNSFYND